MGVPPHHFKRPCLYLAILLLNLVMMIPITTSDYALDSPENSNSLSFFQCNVSIAECYDGEARDDFGFEPESETRGRMLKQGGGRPSTNTLKVDAACGRDKYGYLCTPPGNKDVKRSENCRGSTFNRVCHQAR